MQNKLSLLLLLLLFISGLACASDKLNWKGQIQAKNIVINNQYGDVRLRYGGDKDYLEYIAMVQHIEVDGQLYVDKKQTDNVVYITTGRKDTKLDSKIQDRARIDITVYVPKNKPIHVQTADGSIDAKGLQSDLSVRTDTGNINIRKITGLLNSINNTGLTNIVMQNGVYTAVQKFESVHGKITLMISDSADFIVKMSTSSDIISDFSLKMLKHLNAEPNKTAIIKHNKASSTIIMYSKRGDLALKEHIAIQ